MQAASNCGRMACVMQSRIGLLSLFPKWSSSMELTMEDTLGLLHAITTFLRTHQALWSAHVVEFFYDRLWEDVDKQWWTDLERASIQDLLWLPSGRVQDTWCDSLKNFVRTAQSLALFRQPGENIEKIFPGFCKPKISNLLRQGMNAKKIHEVELLSGVINRIFGEAHASQVVDVGAGQGYLAQVLAFEYGLPVVALDACAHHADVTNRRSERLKKHYTSCSKKMSQNSITKDCVNVAGPQTATFRVMSGTSQMELPYFLSTLALQKSSDPMMEAAHKRGNHDSFGRADIAGAIDQSSQSELMNKAQHSYILAGLHACGDLSATMLKTYVMCEEVRAVVTVGCCYNLLSENCGGVQLSGQCYGFPLSEGVKNLGITLGRRACDLACQSAERWKDVGIESALYNFEQHALRAGFQLVLHRYYPALAKSNPTIGRLGKTRRRKQTKRHVSLESTVNASCSSSWQCVEETASQPDNLSVSNQMQCKQNKFVEFTSAAFQRLGLPCLAAEQLEAVWEEIEPKTVLVGPYWSLRAVLGPVLETFILLDRLLYLQEQIQFVPEGTDMSVGLRKPKLIALFDPNVSPRNMAIIAVKS
ncbi:hypothetical protein GOP47_0012811 [Adiantum capillus-veneris]|uniref:Methyltransferase domain-containing protein n=1 Tax=Adiantum capillus-veneris TaxID=13818 RepID=A0A9D4URE1_ADICA|nr:hypothetical protein GOP47_0012811 [Adiantum capillus-veneris]